MQPSSSFVGVTAVVGAAALLGSGMAVAAPVQWQDCTEMLGIEAEYVPAGLECGTVEVPVDHAQPDADKTTVALTRMKATSGNARSTVFGNPGGPGNYALNFWQPRDNAPAPAGLYENHDLVAVQPRGLYGSNPLTCDIRAAGPVSVNQLHDACYGTDPAYMASFTTENAARDMDAVREALGLATIDYVGVSYGTAIGTDYATLFPERTGRFVLDSNTHPDWRWSEQAAQGAHAQEERVNDIFRWIADRDDYYGLGDTPLKVYYNWKWITDQEVGGAANLTPPPAESRDLPVELRDTQFEQPALDVINGTAPARARGEGLFRALTLQDLTNNAATGLFDATVGATYSEQAWPMLAHILKYYNDGGRIARVDYPTAAKIIQAKEGRAQVMRSDVVMNEIVTCNETAAPADVLGVVGAKLDQYTGGNKLAARAAVERAGDDCVGWNPVARTIHPNGDRLEQKPLVLHSEKDAVTPIAGGHRVAELLGGTLVTVGGGEHGTFRTGNTAVDDVVMQFLEQGTVETDHVPGKPSPDPLPKWDLADREAAAQQGMAAQQQGLAATPPAAPQPAAPVAGADDWYGVHRDAGAAQQQVQEQVQQVQQQLDDARDRAETAVQDVVGQVEAAATSLVAPQAAAQGAEQAAPQA